MPRNFVLDSTSIGLLEKVIANERKQVYNTLQRNATQINDFAPLAQNTDCYIGLSLDGIPAITGDAQTGVQPGVGSVAIYHLVRVPNSRLYFSGQILDTYNLFSTPVKQGTYFPIIREKSGQWLVASEPASPPGSIDVQLYDNGGTNLGDAANADGSVLFEDGSGNLSQDNPGNFIWDAAGTVSQPFSGGDLTSPQTLYLGDVFAGANTGALALFDTDVGYFQQIYFVDDQMFYGQLGNNVDIVVSGGIQSYAPSETGVVSGGSLGNITFSQPFISPGGLSVFCVYGKVIVNLSAFSGTSTYTFATPFQEMPAIMTGSGTGALPSTVVTSLSTTSVTIHTITATSGFLFIEGF
jgi:hypothetical protein